MRFHWADIDPAWTYEVWSDNSGNESRNAASHYDLMTDEAILSLPVNEILEDHALVSLWATWPLLPLAIECGKRWGLKYITCAFLQFKTNSKNLNSWFVGLGHYSRANTEPCLLFKKGEGLGLPRDRSVKQVIGDLPYDVAMQKMFPELLIAPFQKHSRKLPEMYAGVERMYPKASKIRLFARDQRPGWVSLGNELTGNDIREDMERLINEEIETKAG